MRIAVSHKLTAAFFRRVAPKRPLGVGALLFAQARRWSSRMGLLLMACSLLLTLPGCKVNTAKKKELNELLTLRRTDKIPYGTYVAYENLQYIFPQAVININKLSPAHYNSFAAYHNYYTSSSDETSTDKDKTLYIIISPEFSPGAREIDALMEFVGNGNHVFISSRFWGEEFTDSMNIELLNPIFLSDGDSLWVTVKNPVTSDSLSFTYPGRPNDSYFTEYDTMYADILGYNDRKKPNYIRHTYSGGGSIYLHSNPLALTNFFLLHKKNNDYYNNVFSHIPQEISRIEWDEYFRYAGRNNFSALQVIMKYDSLRFAFWLVLLIFLLIYLFESKRKQRIIPRIPPLRNTSLDFVKTIGRLYYQNRDNKNLATKMTAHLMEHIRRRYNIPTSVVDDKFIANLAYKSGYDHIALKNMFYHAKMIQDSPDVSDGYLMEYHKLTEDFYKHQ